MNECLTTPQHEKQIGYWVSEKGKWHMVKDHSDSERWNLLPPYGLLFLISSKGYFIMHHPTDKIAHTMVFVIPVMKHWLEWEIAQWRIDPMTHHTMSERSYHRATSHFLLSFRMHIIISIRWPRNYISDKCVNKTIYYC